jgi:hypothetical protein
MRPAQFARLLLASGDLLPRKRARDQQADRQGLEMKRAVLDRLADLDPEPTEMESALMRIVEEHGPPHGPVRALASTIHEEWQMACSSPQWVELLLQEATRRSED